MTVHNPGRRGICPHCGLEVGLYDDGTVRKHYERDPSGFKVGAKRRWCPGSRTPAAADGVPVDEDALLVGLVETLEGVLTSDAAGIVNLALPVRAWLLEHYELREPAS